MAEINGALEDNVIGYLAGLPEDERKQAFARINGAIKLVRPADEKKPPIVTLGDYVDSPLEHPPYLVSYGAVIRQEITATIGRAGKGKTTLVTNRMIKWGAGMPLFQGTDAQVPCDPLRILLIENEGAAYRMKENFQKLLKAAAMNDEQLALARKNVAVWGDGGYTGLKVDREEDLALIHRGCEAHKPDLVILEPFRGIWKGDENDATAMEAVLDDLLILGKTFNCAIMISHHERKSGAGEDGEEMSAARGSGVLEGKVAVMERFRSIKEDTLRELKWTKSRYDRAPAGLRLRWDDDTRAYAYVPDSELEQEIVQLLEEDPSSWMSLASLAAELGEPKAKLSTPLKELDSKDRIVVKGKSPDGGGSPEKHARIKRDDKDDGKIDY